MTLHDRRARLFVERFEARELPSGIIAAMAARPPAVRILAGGAGGGETGGGGGPVMANNEFLNPTPAISGQPTAHELRRQQFVAKFEGGFVQGPGRFTNQVSQISFRGVGTTSLSLHADLQLGAVVLKDPTQPVFGAASSYDRNINANTALGLDMLGSPADLDRHGRPTKFTFVIDPNISSGIFVEANTRDVNTVTIRYFPDGKGRDGVHSQGRAVVVIRGFLYTLGTNNLLGVFGSTKNSLDPKRYIPT